MAALVGRMAAMAPPAPEARDRAAALLSDARLHPDASAKLDSLRELKDLAVHREPRLLAELLPHLLELWNDPSSSVRSLLVDIIEEVGIRYVEHLPQMMPVLLALLRDESPAFVRRAITTGTNLFRNTLENVLLKGIYTRQVDKLTQDAWLCMLQFKDSVYSVAQQHRNDGVRLHAVKFIETLILLYTPDPAGPSQPPAPDRVDGATRTINVAWIVSGHPLLNAAAMGQEATRTLAILINQLKQPEVSSLPGPVAIVLVNSLAAVAKRRPSMYGRILPALLALAPACEAIKGAQVASVVSALKNAFVQLLKCTHSAAGPWRERLSNALRQMNAGDVADTALNQIERNLRSSDREPVSRPARVKEERNYNDPRGNKRPPPHENGDDDGYGKRLRSTPPPPPSHHFPEPPAMSYSNGGGGGGGGLTPLQLIQTFDTLIKQGEAGPIELLISRLPLETLVDLVIAIMQNFHMAIPPEAHQQLSFPPPAPPPPPMDAMPADVRRDPRRDPRRHDPRRLPSPGPPMMNPRHEELPPPYSHHRPVKMEPGAPVINRRDPRASLRASSSSSARNEPAYAQAHVKTEPDDEFGGRGAHPAYGAASAVESYDEAGVRAELSASMTTGAFNLTPSVAVTRQQQNAIGDSAVLRIMERHKPIMASGGGALRIALLARLTSESDEAMEVLQGHILADYASNVGHELALHALYQLYIAHVSGEGTDSSLQRYESFVLSLSQGLKETLPASDKSLSKLLCELPLFPDALFDFLESLCNPVNEQNSDRITQGLSALWSLILQRPTVRERCLSMALECAVFEIEEIRTKAIRLIANKLYPVEYIMPKVEEFATVKLHSVLQLEKGSEVQGTSTQQEGGEAPETSATRVSRARQYMSLYFALCTKKHALLGELFSVYAQSQKPVKQAIHQQMPVLVRTIGQSSPELLNFISDPPAGSENLILQVLQVLTETTAPSPELISTVKQLHDTKLKDPVLLIPILSSLSKDEVLPVFPRLVNLPPEKFQTALARILQGSAHTGPALTPAEVLIALHGIDHQKDSVPLKKITEACNACFEQRNVFKQDVLAKVLNQLVEQTPLPMLFMRTVIQAVGTFPSLVDFVMDILIRLVNRQIWKVPQLWIGFLKCANETVPHSFRALLQLPCPQLENALVKFPKLKAPLAAHANQPAVRASVPRSSQVLLGLIQEETPSNEASGPADVQQAEPSSGAS